MVVSIRSVGKMMYEVHSALIRGGFTEGHALSIVSNCLAHLLTQNILREEAESKRILDTTPTT